MWFSCQEIPFGTRLAQRTGKRHTALDTTRLLTRARHTHDRYQGIARPITVTATMKDLVLDADLSDKQLLDGDIGTALVFTTLAMRAGKRVPMSLVLMVRTHFSLLTCSSVSEYCCV